LPQVFALFSFSVTVMARYMRERERENRIKKKKGTVEGAICCSVSVFLGKQGEGGWTKLDVSLKAKLP